MARKVKVIMESAPNRTVARKIAKRHNARVKKFGPGSYMVYKFVKKRSR